MFADEERHDQDRNKDQQGRRNYDIYLVDVDGTNQTILTTNGSVDWMPVYDPEGKYIYFVSNRGLKWNIWRMEPIDGGAKEAEKGDTSY